jgi:hypothetical protein
MEKDKILAQLKNIVDQRTAVGRGGKYKSELSHKFAEVDPKYKNEFEDDGSIAYQRLQATVLKELADYLFKDVSMSALKAVPQEALNKVINKLKKARELEIDKEMREIKQKEKGISLLKKDKDIIKYLGEIDRAKDFTREELAEYADPELKYFKGKIGDFKDVKPKPKLSEDMVKEIEKIFYPESKISEALGNGLGGKRKRPKGGKSDYHKHVSAYMKKHKGATLSEAAKAWRK